MEMIERAVARNLLDFVEAARLVAPQLRAAATACGGGVAAFLGADSPLTTVKGAGPDIGASDVNAAEDSFARMASLASCSNLRRGLPRKPSSCSSIGGTKSWVQRTS